MKATTRMTLPKSSRPLTPQADSCAESFLDKVAVAKRLGVKPKTVGEWANQGKLPAYRLGPYLRFKWAEVEAHLAATCQLQRGVRSAERGAPPKAESKNEKAEIWKAESRNLRTEDRGQKTETLKR